MQRLKLTKERRERFLQALANTGSVTAAIAVAGSSRSRVYALRRETWHSPPPGRKPRKLLPTGLRRRRAAAP